MRTCKTESHEKLYANASVYHSQHFAVNSSATVASMANIPGNLPIRKRWRGASAYAQNRRTPSWIVHKALRLLREEDWSPKQISGYLGLKGINISHERIYREVRADETGELRAHCRHKMKYRRHKGHKRKTSGRTLIPNRISIHQRPAEADGTRFGDWEMDLVIGKGQKVLF